MKKTLAIALFLTALASAQNLTTQQRVQLSNQMTATLSNQSEGVLRAPDNRMINIFQQILRGADRHDVNYQLLVGEDNNTVNAYSLPDGRVVLLTGLLNALPQGDDNALAFVLAHEISHIELKHVDKLAIQAGLTEMALGWLTSNQSSALQALAGVGSQLLTSGYSREMEAAADGNGLELMSQAGYNPRGALVTLQLFKNLEDSQGQARIFPTHPRAADRLHDAEVYLEQHGY